MQRFKNVGDLFQDVPWQWGLRGDPFLWEEMKRHLSKVPLPNSPEELRDILFQTFNELTGRPLWSGDVTSSLKGSLTVECPAAMWILNTGGTRLFRH